MDWELVGFVKASSYRKSILLSLKEKNMTPKELAEKLNLYISHVSTTLSQLVEKKLVGCLTPKLRKGKIYSITELGESVITHLISEN